MTQSKSRTALKTIGEAADLIGEDVHTLRTWEKSFSCIRPIRRHSGHRYYRPKDVLLLQVIQKLLREHGLSRKGVQKIVRQTSNDQLIQTWLNNDSQEISTDPLLDVVKSRPQPLSPSILPLPLDELDETSDASSPTKAETQTTLETVKAAQEPSKAVEAETVIEQPIVTTSETSKTENISEDENITTSNVKISPISQPTDKQQLKEILQELQELQHMLKTQWKQPKDLSSSLSFKDSSLKDSHFTPPSIPKKTIASGKLTALFKK